MAFPQYIPTSKENALYSIFNYLQTAFSNYVPLAPLKSPAVYPIGYTQAFNFPCITIEDAGLPDLMNSAEGDNVGGGYKGKYTSTLVKINIYDQNIDETDVSVAYPYAEQNVRRLRDLVKQALTQSGQVDPSNNLIMPVIHLLDPIALGLPGIDTGSTVTIKSEEAGGFRDQFIANSPEAPNTKQYSIYVKIQWLEFSASPSGLINFTTSGIFTNPNATAGGDLTGHYPNPLVIGLSGIPITNRPITSGEVLTYIGNNNIQWEPSAGSGGDTPAGPAGGDLSGVYPNPTVVAINGIPVSAGIPASQGVLQYNGTQYVPTVIPSLNLGRLYFGW